MEIRNMGNGIIVARMSLSEHAILANALTSYNDAKEDELLSKLIYDFMKPKSERE